MKPNMTLACAVAAMLVLAAPALAEDAPPQRLTEAWKSALAGGEPVVSPQQYAKLNNLAFQAAAARVCEGFELDEAKFTAALADATAPKADLSPEDTALQQDFVLVEFGMRYGMLIAEGEAQEKSFCDNAAALKKQTEVPVVWE